MKNELLIVGTAGFLGSISRYLIGVWIGGRNSTAFPIATLLVNLVGCFLIGILSILVERSFPQHRSLYLFGSVGFLGAFTTFSAFGLETLQLLRNQQPSLAFANVIANVALGLVAVWAGRSLASVF